MTVLEYYQSGGCIVSSANLTSMIKDGRFSEEIPACYVGQYELKIS